MWKDLEIVNGKPRNSQNQGFIKKANQEIENIGFNIINASAKKSNYTSKCHLKCISKNQTPNFILLNNFKNYMLYFFTYLLSNTNLNKYKKQKLRYWIDIIKFVWYLNITNCVAK